MTTMYEMDKPWRSDGPWTIRPVEVIRETPRYWMIPTDRMKWQGHERVPMVEERVLKSLHDPRFFETPEACREWHVDRARRNAQRAREGVLFWEDRIAAVEAAEVVEAVKP